MAFLGFQADFTTPLGSAVTLSAGAKYIYRHNSSDQTDYLWNGTSFVENAASSLQYDFYNRIGAAYTELDTKLGNWGVNHIKTIYGTGYKLEVTRDAAQ